MPTISRLTFLIAFLFFSAWYAPVSGAADSDGREHRTGFILAVPDRGFAGNEAARETFRHFADSVHAEHARLLFVTDERTRPMFEQAAEALVDAGAEQLVVLPLFLLESHPKLAALRSWYGNGAVAGNVPVRFAPALGRTYFGVEALADMLRRIDTPPEATGVTVVGYGGDGEERERQMAEELAALSARAAHGFGFAEIDSMIWPDVFGFGQQGEERLEAAQNRLRENGQAGNTAIVSFNLGHVYDSMMSLNATLKYDAPDSVRVIGDDVVEHPAVPAWMQREVNRARTLHADELGVVFLAHGADYHWNERMRQAIAPLAGDYKIEFAFSMADQPSIEKAVARLEARGARAVVVVRVFGLSASFLGGINRMLGLDVETGDAPAPAGHHHHHGAGTPGPRILSGAMLTTAGGLEDDELFARALLDRAVRHSGDPDRETLILVAHGVGDDARNRYWMDLLASLRETMLEHGGDRFRAIEYGTWREDWPDKREQAVERIRGLVADASADGGRAVVIPARTTGTGPAEELLAGLDFELLEGFAPHPLFLEWFEQQIELGRRQLERQYGIRFAE